jgi:hypothetical protein
VPNNFDECDKGGNHYASVHNSDLKKLLRAMDGVQIVDLNAAFTNIINPAKGTLYISAQLHNIC